MNTRLIRSLFMGLLIMVLIALALTFLGLRHASKNLETAQKEQIKSYLLAQEMRQSSDDLTKMSRSFVVTGDFGFKHRYSQVVAIRNGSAFRPQDYYRAYWDFVAAGQQNPRPFTQIKKSLLTLIKEEGGVSTKELSKLEETFNKSETLAKLETDAMSMVQGIYRDNEGNYARLGVPNPEKAKEMLFDKNYLVNKADIMKSLDDFFVLMEKRTAENLSVARTSRSRMQKLFMSLFLVALISIGVIGYLGRKLADEALAERAAAQEQAEAENEQLNSSVISILETVYTLSQRDLTAKAPPTEDIVGPVSDSVNALTDETVKVLTGVTDIANQVALISGDLNNQAEKVSQTAAEERKTVQLMVDSLLEAIQTMDKVSTLAEQSNESAGKATTVTDQALETVVDTVSDMENIRETISETEKRIKRLGDRSQEITGIVNLINTISERTHELALNASMQAAVAGDAGRGFAVVAEEVQRLAESSRNATEQIAMLVKNIQVETKETIDTVNRTISQVVEGSEQAQKAGKQMQQTKVITSELVDLVRNIAEASEKQKTMSGGLLEAVRRIGDSTEATEMQISEQNQGTESLQQAASRLLESVGVFKLPITTKE